MLGDAVVEPASHRRCARLATLGAPSSRGRRAEQTLKLVTVLFLDVVGSTSLTSASTRRTSTP